MQIGVKSTTKVQLFEQPNSTDRKKTKLLGRNTLNETWEKKNIFLYWKKEKNTSTTG